MCETITSKLKPDGDSGDGKRTFIVSDPDDGNCRIEVDTDDVDRAAALRWHKRIIQCVNACRGLKDLSAVKALPRE